jgi:hypothetical protein
VVACGHVSEFTPQQLSNLIWSIAKIGINSEQASEICSVIGFRMLNQIDSFKVRLSFRFRLPLNGSYFFRRPSPSATLNVPLYPPLPPPPSLSSRLTFVPRLATFQTRYGHSPLSEFTRQQSPGPLWTRESQKFRNLIPKSS